MTTTVSRPAATQASTRKVIVVENLSKTYPNGTQAVRGISFHVNAGEIYGILGPNGAGKSTTIGIIATLVRPTDGRAIVEGIDVTEDRVAVRTLMGFAAQDAGVDDLATGMEFLLLQGRLRGLDKDLIRTRARQLLKLFELEGAANKRIKSYSGGMKRRIDLAGALIHLPKILFLDEPSEGLDPRSRMGLWNTLKRLRQRLGTTILLSTHYMEEADRLCDRIAIIDAGRIVVEGTPSQLKASVGGETLVIEYSSIDAASKLSRADDVIKRQRLASRTVRGRNELTCFAPSAAAAAPGILRALDEAGVAPASLRIQQPSLDDVYLNYTGRKIAEAEHAPANGGGKK